jgi:predicted Zn-dependent protease
MKRKPKEPINSREQLQLASRSLAAGQLDKAERLCREVLEREPNQVFALGLAASSALGRGEPEVAVGYLTRAVSLNPQSPPLLVNLGEAYRRHEGRPLQARAQDRPQLGQTREAHKSRAPALGRRSIVLRRSAVLHRNRVHGDPG